MDIKGVTVFLWDFLFGEKIGARLTCFYARGRIQLWIDENWTVRELGEPCQLQLVNKVCDMGYKLVILP